MFLNMESIYNIIFFYCLFRIRNITDEFNISSELKSMIIMKVLTDIFYAGTMIFLYDSPFIILGFGEYIQMVLCLWLLYVTAIEPIYKSYQPNDIIPFPLNEEMISNLGSAMVMPISSKFFYDFLAEDIQDTRGLSLFSLYADLQIYYNLITEITETS